MKNASIVSGRYAKDSSPSGGGMRETSVSPWRMIASARVRRRPLLPKSDSASGDIVCGDDMDEFSVRVLTTPRDELLPETLPPIARVHQPGRHESVLLAPREGGNGDQIVQLVVAGDPDFPTSRPATVCGVARLGIPPSWSRHACARVTDDGRWSRVTGRQLSSAICPD